MPSLYCATCISQCQTHSHTHAHTHKHTHTQLHKKYLCTRLKLIFKFHIHDINELHNKRQTWSKDSFPNAEEDTPPRFSSFLMSMLLHSHRQMLLLLFALNWPAMSAYKEYISLNHTNWPMSKNILTLCPQSLRLAWRLHGQWPACTLVGHRPFRGLFSAKDVQVWHRMVQIVGRGKSSWRMAHINPIT